MNGANSVGRPLVYDSRYSRRLGDLLLGLGHRGRIAFAASCAHRLLPWVRHFRAEAGLVPNLTADIAIAAVWNQLEVGDGAKKTSIDMPEIIDQLEQIAPETEIHRERSTSFCLSAVSAISEAIWLCDVDDGASAVHSANAVTDTIDLWTATFGLADPETPPLLRPMLPRAGEAVGRDSADRQRWQQGMETHPRIQAELARQEMDIDELTRDIEISPVTAKRIRDRSAAAVVIPFPDDPIWQAVKEFGRKSER